MPYIGNTIRAADDYRLIDDISSSFNGSTTSFALQVAGSAPVPFPKSPQQVLISVNGVIQEPDPTGASGFNLVGTNIVFSSAPTNGHAFFGIIYATADYLNSGGNFPSGSLGAPSITFVGDEDTGIYRKGSGSVGFVSNSTEIANTDSNGITISSGNLILGDSSGASDDRIKLGASGDLQIYHNSNNSFIENSTGNLHIKGKAGEESIVAIPDGSVELYFDNAKKAETVTGGFTVTGVCTATSFAGDGSSLSGINTDLVSDTSPQLGGNLDVNTKNINFGDSSGSSDDRLNFGASTDMSIYHNGTNNIINSAGSGQQLIMQSNNEVRLTGTVARIMDENNSETMAKFSADSSVELYYDNARKLQTNSTGLQIGTTSARYLIENQTNSDGTQDIARIGLNRDNGSTGDRQMWLNFEVGANIAMAKFQARSANDTGTAGNFLEIDAVNGNVDIPRDSCELQIGASNDLKLYHNGTDSYISNGTNKLRIGNTHNDGIKFFTNNSTRWNIEGNGNFIPDLNNSFDIGSTSYRVANIYTNDLNLSNEGSSNDVDGTWGNYTIQEGYEDLFLVNNRTGKKFKFNLTEVV